MIRLAELVSASSLLDHEATRNGSQNKFRVTILFRNMIFQDGESGISINSLNFVHRQNANVMFKLLRTDSSHPDFRSLVEKLDTYLAFIDGEDHAFYAQYNKVDLIKHTVVAYENEIPLACGAIKVYDLTTMEVKRMYTDPESRGKGLASKIIAELENWATELGYIKCILETGIRQQEAISLYHKLGYQIIENYGQYAGVETSVCFEKTLVI